MKLREEVEKMFNKLQELVELVDEVFAEQDDDDRVYINLPPETEEEETRKRLFNYIAKLVDGTKFHIDNKDNKIEVAIMPDGDVYIKDYGMNPEEFDDDELKIIILSTLSLPEIVEVLEKYGHNFWHGAWLVDYEKTAESLMNKLEEIKEKIVKDDE